MCGKPANTMEHQPNYVAVNYSSVIQVLKLAGTCSFPLQPVCLKGLLTETTEEVMAINISWIIITPKPLSLISLERCLWWASNCC